MSAFGSSSSSSDVSDICSSVTFRDVDEKERELVDQFCLSGCDCKFGSSDEANNSCNGTPCFKLFSRHEVTKRREQALAMSSYNKEGLDLYVIGHFSSSDNQDHRLKLCLNGKRVCLTTFSFLMAMSRGTVSAIHAHYLENGLEVRTHQSIGKPPHSPYNRLSHQRREEIKIFLENLIKTDGVFIPGRVPSHSDFKAVRFPSHWTKELIYEKYIRTCKDMGQESYCSRNTFISNWKAACPQLGIMGRRSDVCHICYENSEKLALFFRESIMNNPLDDWTSKIDESIIYHIRRVQTERQDYNSRVEFAKKHGNEVVLLTMDFSEAKSIPYSSTQIGKTHFMSLYKVNIFAVENEGMGTSNIYMFDESDQLTSGKGSSCTASMLYHELQRHIGKPRIEIQCDNCGGQNKNFIIMGFIAYMVIQGIFEHISVHFLVENHSKFSADRTFGVISKSFRNQQRIDCYEDLVEVINRASSKFSAIPTKVNGNSIVKWYEWKTFIKRYFRAIPNIKKLHVFTFSSNTPGFVTVKEWSDSQETKTLNLLKKGVELKDLPPSIPDEYICEKKQLPEERIQYLLNNVAPLIFDPDKKDNFIKTISDHHYSISKNEETVLPGPSKTSLKRCHKCNGCDLYNQYIKNEVKKCRYCKYCANPSLKKQCIKFRCHQDIE